MSGRQQIHVDEGEWQRLRRQAAMDRRMEGMSEQARRSEAGTDPDGNADREGRP